MTGAFKHIGLIGKYGTPEAGSTLNEIGNHLKKLGIDVLVDRDSCAATVDPNLEAVSRHQLGERCDLVIIVGGDGTMLNAARSLSQYQVPLLGINLGRLGFMVDVPVDNMYEKLAEILAGDYVSEERLLLNATVLHEDEPEESNNAFNDVVIHKADVARMIEFDTFINGDFLFRLRADGLIVSTPSGSTAYAMSGGGPIMHPNLNALALVPICPHTLTNRPTVISGDSTVEIIVRDSDALATCDGQIKMPLLPGDRVKIGRTEETVQLIHPRGYSYFDILREKFHWHKRP